MVKRREAGAAGHGAGEREMRDQEVLRANRELAAYFKGRRTEREARSALKIIKAFVRHRERQDVKSRTPLPGARTTSVPAEQTDKKKKQVKPLRVVKRRSAARLRAHREPSPDPVETPVAQQTNGDGAPE
jgi:hypothetical protein